MEKQTVPYPCTGARTHMQRGTCLVKVFPSKSEVSQLGSETGTHQWVACQVIIHTTYQNATQTSHRGTPVTLLFFPSPLESPWAPAGAQPLPETILHFWMAKIRRNESLLWAVKRQQHEPIQRIKYSIDFSENVLPSLSDQVPGLTSTGTHFLQANKSGLRRCHAAISPESHLWQPRISPRILWNKCSGWPVALPSAGHLY